MELSEERRTELLQKIAKAQGFDSIDNFPHVSWRVGRRKPGHLHGVLSRLRDGARPNTGLLRGLRRELSGRLAEPRRHHLRRPAMDERGTRIREQNDAFRRTFSGGKVVMTASVAALPAIARAKALLEVTRFSNFNKENDPHGEHDFGNFELVGWKFYWKIDLYNSTMDGGSEDPTDPEKITRVLTLMLAEDY